MKDKTDKPAEQKAEATTENEVGKSTAETNNDCSCEKEKCSCAQEECKKCDGSMRQAEEYKAKYLRAIADYQNYERRVQNQRIEWTKSANKTVILKLLSFLDDLERAEAFIKDPNLAHIKDSFNKILKNEGLEEIEVLNKQYDPYTAEVVDMKEGEEDNVVIAVLKKGYNYNGQLLRVAHVTVSKKAEKKL